MGKWIPVWLTLPVGTKTCRWCLGVNWLIHFLLHTLSFLTAQCFVLHIVSLTLHSSTHSVWQATVQAVMKIYNLDFDKCKWVKRAERDMDFAVGHKKEQLLTDWFSWPFVCLIHHSLGWLAFFYLISLK